MHRLFEADAFQNRVNAKAIGELAYALNRFVASLAHDVCSAELFGEFDPGGMPAKDDDLLGAKPPRGDHATQSNGAVSDNRHALPWAHLGYNGGVMSRAHYV